ncbi:DUF4349 domain-containing protein, partial [Catenulispora pinisilvae]|uniref:DUF4349 domain-containing protein n=1 Tax=Catenulispora pinisilvae TaxID=2705253 RepID=UPI0018924CAA
MSQGTHVGRRRAAAVLTAIVIVGLSAGCGAGSSKSASSSAARAAGPAGVGNSGGGASGDSAPNQAAAPSAGQNSLAKAPVAGRSIVYSATMTVRTKDVTAATANAETLAESNGGFVGGENSQSGTVPDVQGLTQSTVTLRVPSAAFEKVIGQLGTGGVVQDETRSASDVTAQVVDTGTRITAQQASIARITDLMKSATNLSDVVTLEGELSRRESDLESMQAQLAALNDQVSLSTITVTFLVPQATAPAATPTPKHQNAFQRGLHDGWQAFMGTVKVLLVIIGVLLPFAALAAVLWWPVTRSARVVARRRACLLY